MKSACRKISYYWWRKERNRETAFDQPFASWKQTVRCECKICWIVATVLRDGSGNEGEVVDGEYEDHIIRIHIAPTSGIVLTVGKIETEIFVLERTCIPSARTLSCTVNWILH
jgi:hypothetical protein